MFKLLRLRFLAAAVFCLLLAASVYAGPIKISFGENAGAFSLTVDGGPVNRDLKTTKELGASWELVLAINETDHPDSLDVIGVLVDVTHVMAPHGELKGLLFQFNPDPNALLGSGMVTVPSGIIIRNHMDHRDKYQAVLTFTVVMGQITTYKLHVEGRHCNGDDCPELPNEVTIPEPTTMFLFGTGLAAVAIKVRKRLKNRKSG